ncbi:MULTISPECIES: NupC/NupG family nucleoside CNT transporter [Gallibacterium]|uniref:Nucleoside permease n=2 Tax=Gallibacterium anatis TaxID=750 RepID=A0A0A2XII5_9PAST|nr:MULTISPECIES: NupC/NupG family nucleoside CNT transporter [Gallibacterium]KGQ26143.1 nucleoside transporter NupC [Gallibacterium anatis CCM5995]KGQ32146.1 nucleoside transporter NupC [Gallibacterium anatis]KGQ41434.1 nucleoside transporter NupC [Gallibacterium anatis IPDH697-78]KGQ48045.1 nucleoside transporter NupC [Gallibacterium anatis]KGQ52112.1 nucleoside transporter NupC [Gallibacterium anatis 10672-6]
MDSLMSIIGIVVLLAIAFLLSNNRRAISLRTVGGAFLIQIGIGALVLYSELGRQALLGAAEAVNKVIAYGNEGISFLFGGLVSDKMFELFGGGGFIFAFRVLPAIVFFASLISVLYYLGIMQWVIRLIGGFLQKILGTSKTESMSAAANIFVGQTEAPLIVRPYIATMTQSELFAIMCGGLASVAGSVMIGYAQMGVPLPYLIAASFMAAPGGLLFAKILFPQTEKTNDELKANDVDEKPSNVLDAAAMGASSGMQLAMNVGAMLLAFIALIALLNGIIGGVGGWFGYGELNLQTILGWVFRPLAWVIGVPWNEAEIAGAMIGEKLVLNEFVAYVDFVKYLSPDSSIVLAEKTKAIITFALCGFANFSSIAILIGGLGTMAPNRRKDIARLGIKAVIAGSLSNLMSAAIAGLFIGLVGPVLMG